MRVGEWKRHTALLPLTALIGNTCPQNLAWHAYVRFESVLTEFLQGAEHTSR